MQWILISIKFFIQQPHFLIRLFRYLWPLYYSNGSFWYSRESRFLCSAIRLHLERWSWLWNVQGLKFNFLKYNLILHFFYRLSWAMSSIYLFKFWRILTRGVEHSAYIYIYQHYRLVDLPWQSAFTWYILLGLFSNFLPHFHYYYSGILLQFSSIFVIIGDTGIVVL